MKTYIAIAFLTIFATSNVFADGGEQNNNPGPGDDSPCYLGVAVPASGSCKHSVENYLLHGPFYGGYSSDPIEYHASGPAKLESYGYCSGGKAHSTEFVYSALVPVESADPNLFARVSVSAIGRDPNCKITGAGVTGGPSHIFKW